MPDVDLLLLHAPSVYDFRKHAIMYGPVSDLIPSSPVFEMYPLGFLTMANYLEERGFTVRIVNLALRMINDRRFDVERFLAKINPMAVGIDFHWLPHAHGSIEVANLMKQIHPSVSIIFGGLSATYFHEELIDYPSVDYVIRGDSSEPPLFELLSAIKRGSTTAEVPNLTWQENGETRINPFTCIPDSLDYVDLGPERVMKMALRHRDLQSILPFNGWWENPITAVFTVKGCSHQCVTCGCSHDASGILTKRRKPLYRTPENLVRNIQDISMFSRGPIFLIGDLRQSGSTYASQVLDLLRKAKIKNEVIFEFFRMPPLEYLHEIDRSVTNWSIELSPESHDESIRRVQDVTTFYTNEKMESVISEALSLNCHRIDVFFMIGLPQQSAQSVSETIDYCDYLYSISDRRLGSFISPMGPFLDPGSRGFEDPDRFGYTLFAHTLEEHRQLLTQPSWKHILNFETQWMTRDELVDATYDAAERLNAIKMKHGRIGKKRGTQIAGRVERARELKARLDALQEGSDRDRQSLQHLYGEINEFSVSTVCDKRELFWKRHVVNFRLSAIAKVTLSYLGEFLNRRKRKVPAEAVSAPR